MRARLFIATILAVTLLPLAAAPSSAAPPGNDERPGAVVLRLGDRVVQNTSQATTTAQDAALNEECGAPATKASVWYKFTPGVSRDVVLDTTTSSYSAGMLVFQGPPSTNSLVACGPGLVGLSLAAGKTYNIMVISDTDVNGGRLVLSLKKAPPPPRVHVTIAKRALAFRGGAAQIHGNYTCANGDSAELVGTLFQRAGRLKISAEFYKEVRCNGKRHTWKARLVSPTATYAKGRARANVTITTCGIFQCRQDKAQRRVRLVSAGGRSGHRSLPPSISRPEQSRPLVERQRHWPTN